MPKKSNSTPEEIIQVDPEIKDLTQENRDSTQTDPAQPENTSESARGPAGSHDLIPETPASTQTDPAEPEKSPEISRETRDPDPKANAPDQPDSGEHSEASEKLPSAQTDPEKAEPGINTLLGAEDPGAPPQEEPLSNQTDPEKIKTPRRRKKTDNIPAQPDAGEPESSKDLPEAPQARKRPARTRPAAPVVSIDDRRTVETDEDKARNDLLDMLESQKTGRILTGTIQGVERPEDSPSRSLAVLYHGDFKVLIPAEEAVEPPEDFRGRLPEDVLHYMLTKRLGAEVDYLVKGIDPKAGVAVASRLEAMRAKRKRYYLGTDRDGNNLLYGGVCAEARIVSVIRAGIFVDLFGLEIYIPLRELSYQRWMDASAYFQTGQRILVKVLDVDRSDRNHIKATASVKQASENPYDRALRRYSVGNRYVGMVSMVDTNGVFVALDGGIDCLCSYPKRGRPPRGSRVTVRILGINRETNRIWGAITHIATPR
jgi:predicted RNA-binding protein with RPS1 domain